jgi:bifunctional DNase/RNase
MNLHEAIKLLAANVAVEEVFISQTRGSTFVAEIKVNGETKLIVPSVGVYLAKVVGAPIYFESDFAQETDSQMVV